MPVCHLCLCVLCSLSDECLCDVCLCVMCAYVMVPLCYVSCVMCASVCDVCLCVMYALCDVYLCVMCAYLCDVCVQHYRSTSFILYMCRDKGLCLPSSLKLKLIPCTCCMFCILVLVLNESISRLIKDLNRTHMYWTFTSLPWQHIAYQ